MLRWTGTTETFGRTLSLGDAATGSGFDVASGSTNFIINQVLTGSGGITKTGGGTLNLVAANTYAGTTYVNSGILQLGNSLISSGSVAGDISATATLIVDNPTDITLPGKFSYSGGGRIIKLGAGTLSLTSPGSNLYDNLYSEGTTLIAGANASSYSTMTAANNIIVALDGGKTATVTVSGADGNHHSSSLTSTGGTTFVGYYGSGTMNVLGGAAVAGNTFSLGNQSGGVGTLNISGSDPVYGARSRVTMNGNSTFYVGNGGTGTVNVTNVGYLSTGLGLVANGAGSVGTINVSNRDPYLGTPSGWYATGMYLGYGGSGTLNITDGGLVDLSSGTLSLSTLNSGSSTLNVNGGKLNTGSIAVGSGAAPVIKLTNPTLANGGGYALTLANFNDITLGMVITDAAGGAGGIDKFGTGTLTLTAANTFSGGMQIENGGVVIGDANGLALQNSTVTLNNNNGLSLNGLSSVKLGGLAGPGTLYLGSTALSVGNNNASTTYAGALSGRRQPDQNRHGNADAYQYRQCHYRAAERQQWHGQHHGSGWQQRQFHLDRRRNSRTTRAKQASSMSPVHQPGGIPPPGM